MSARRRRNRASTFGWRLGCGAFGVLDGPALPGRLVETVSFTDHEAVVIDLADGVRRIVAYNAVTHRFARLTPEAAAERAGMPVPVTLKVGDMHRRIDPFHSERHLSAEFRALVGIMRARQLPCGYSLLLHRTGAWDGEFVGPNAEDPEQTAANVSETRARYPDWNLRTALLDQLRRDANIAADDIRELLDACAWSAVLDDFDAALHAHRDEPPYPTGALPASASDAPRARAREVQLSLL